MGNDTRLVLTALLVFAMTGLVGMRLRARVVPLDGLEWRAVELLGQPVPEGLNSRGAHLIFHSDRRVSGSDGCNRIVGTYEISGEQLTFAKMGGTQMACPGTGEIERAIRQVLQTAVRFVVTGDSLALFDAAGRRLAAFSGHQPPASAVLGDTTWRLVQFEGSDDTRLRPEDPARYTLAFGVDGALAVQVDCNRGRSTWISIAPAQIRFGPLALTRAACPPGSLHDRIVRHWDSIRSYVIRNGHLYLALQADGGIYEFESVPRSNR